MWLLFEGNECWSLTIIGEFKLNRQDPFGKFFKQDFIHEICSLFYSKGLVRWRNLTWSNLNKQNKPVSRIQCASTLYRNKRYIVRLIKFEINNVCRVWHCRENFVSSSEIFESLRKSSTNLGNLRKCLKKCSKKKE